MQTSIGCKHPKLINAAREFAIARSECPFTDASLWGNVDTPFPFDLELCKISSSFSSRDIFQSSIPYSTQCPRSIPIWQLTEKRRRRGLSCLKMADSRAPSMVFGCLRPMLVCRCLSYECWQLCPWSRKDSHSSKWRWTEKDHKIPCHTRLRFDEILAAVCSCTKIRQFRLSSKQLQRLTWIFVK